MKRLLLLSNSVSPGMGFLEHAQLPIKDFLGESIDRVLFIPYAVVTVPHDEVERRLSERLSTLGYSVESIHKSGDPVAAVANAQAIAVSGGNTFHLLAEMYRHKLVGPVRERVLGGIPYIGWSAGSNLACPTLKTTNDMPIAEPESFDGLGLVPFQINPHYTEAQLEGHGGESRDQRIEECITVNRDVNVVGLREGSMLRVEGEEVTLLGGKSMRVFRHGMAARDCSAGDDLGFLTLG